MEREAINPESLFNSREYGFSQVVISNPGKMIFISGQVAWDERMNVVGKNDLAMQTQKTLENLAIAIKAAGGNMEDVTMLRIYKVKYQQEDGQIISQALKAAFGSDQPPASTWISVAGLANEEFMIEIEAQAVIQNF